MRACRDRSAALVGLHLCASGYRQSISSCGHVAVTPSLFRGRPLIPVWFRSAESRVLCSPAHYAESSFVRSRVYFSRSPSRSPCFCSSSAPHPTFPNIFAGALVRESSVSVVLKSRHRSTQQVVHMLNTPHTMANQRNSGRALPIALKFTSAATATIASSAVVPDSGDD